MSVGGLGTKNTTIYVKHGVFHTFDSVRQLGNKIRYISTLDSIVSLSSERLLEVLFLLSPLKRPVIENAFGGTIELEIISHIQPHLFKKNLYNQHHLSGEEDFSLHVFSEDVVGLSTSPRLHKAVGHLGPFVFAPVRDKEMQWLWDVLLGDDGQLLTTAVRNPQIIQGKPNHRR